MDHKWMDLLESLGIYGTSAEEQEELRKGMAFYLRTHGLREEKADAYGLGFVKRRMGELPPGSRKEFLLAVPLLWQYDMIKQRRREGEEAEEKTQYELAGRLEKYPSLSGFWEPLF